MNQTEPAKAISKIFRKSDLNALDIMKVIDLLKQEGYDIRDQDLTDGGLSRHGLLKCIDVMLQTTNIQKNWDLRFNENAKNKVRKANGKVVVSPSFTIVDNLIDGIKNGNTRTIEGAITRIHLFSEGHNPIDILLFLDSLFPELEEDIITSDFWLERRNNLGWNALNVLEMKMEMILKGPRKTDTGPRDTDTLLLVENA